MISYRADNWSKADPIKLLTPEQRDQAYPPTDKPEPTTAERDEVIVQSDRLGDRIVEENDERSKGAKFAERFARNVGDVKDATNEVADTVQDLITASSPTGTVAETRAPIYAQEQPRDGVHAGDWLTGTAGLCALLVGAGKLAWRHSRRESETEN